MKQSNPTVKSKNAERAAAGGDRRLKVVLVCHSDLMGGAAIVTWRLMNALIEQGVDARMLVYTRMSKSGRVDVVGSRFGRGSRFVLERMGIFLQNGFNRADLFKVSVSNFGQSLWRHPWVKEADVVHLNWINQGLLSLRGIGRISRLGKRIIWTMHDMWPLTGICHHAFECDNFKDKCGHCPFLHGHPSARDLSHRVWKRKKALYERTPISFVAVSSWLAGRAVESSLLGGLDVSVIPNAFPIDSFMTTPQAEFPTFDPVPERRRLIFGAARLDDPIKNIDALIDALNYLFDERPDISCNTGVILFGSIRDKTILDRLRFPYLYMGRVDDPKLLRQLYASSLVVISSSHYETLPGTLIEGKAAGCVPVSFDHGGQRDIITHLKDGYLARYGDTRDLANGILWALESRLDRKALHDSVGERFSSSVIARRYIDLYTK